MSDPQYTFQTRHEIWNDASGDHITVGPDSDGLDLIEVTWVGSKGTIESRIVLNRTEARLVAQALNLQAEEKTDGV